MAILYVKIAKHGEIIKAEFIIFTTSRKTQRGQRVDYKGTTNADPVSDIPDA